jgi:hypothetical protein
MNETNIIEENKRLKILVDIYKNENERLKYEYRILHDKYMLETDFLRSQIEKHEYSLSYKVAKTIKQNIFYRLLKKIKHVFGKKG